MVAYFSTKCPHGSAAIPVNEKRLHPIGVLSDTHTVSGSCASKLQISQAAELRLDANNINVVI